MLSHTQLTQWADQGFVNLGAIFATEELGEIGAEYDRLVVPSGQQLGNERQGRFPYRAMLNFRSDVLARYVLHPALLRISEQLLGEDVRFWWDQGINKKPGAGSFIRWHQDNGYEAGKIPAYLTFWLALDDSTQENGGLEIIPGSHLEGQRPHEMNGVHAEIAAGELDPRRAEPLDAAAGDVLLFSSLLVHQTVGNLTSNQERRAWVIQYCRGDQQNSVTGERYDNRAWAVREGVHQTQLASERRFDLSGDRP
ncbi:MAG: phytanoyl-CoA dioxygenase family protein [Myxococcota bacterium]